MLKPAVKMLGFLIEGAGFIGTVGTVATVGEIVAKRAGLLPKEKSLIGEATHFVLDVGGFNGATSGAKAPAQLGAAPATICPLCQGAKSIDISGPATLKNCDNHEAAVVALGGYTEAMYDGWAKSYGIADLGAASKCKKPNRDHFQTAAGFQALPYAAAMVVYQQCVADEKDGAAKAKADAEAAKAQHDKDVKDAYKKGRGIQQKLSTQIMSAAQKKYEQELTDLKAQYAAEQDASKQAAIQAQIDAANQGKAAAEKVAADLQAKVTSEAQAKQIADLQAQILAAGQKSGGVDQLMQFMVMQQQAQAQQQYAQQPMMMAPQMMVAPDGGAMPWSAPGEVVPVVEQQDGGGEMYFEGQAAPEPEPNLGNYFGIEGLSDDDGQLLFNTVQSGNVTSEDIEALLREQESYSGACLSGCSIPR